MRRITVLPVAMVAVLLFGCFYSSPKVTVKPGDLTVQVGARARFKAAAKDQGLDDESFVDITGSEDAEWQSDNDEGLTSLGGGVFLAKKPGTYKVRAEWTNSKNLSGSGSARVEVVGERGETGSLGGDVQLYEDVPPGEPEEIFKVGNDLAVFNGGTSPTVKFGKDYVLTEIWTYHWNSSKGTAPGTIALEAADGTRFGPWNAEAVNNVYWVAKPNITVPAGSYRVIDSDPVSGPRTVTRGARGCRGRRAYRCRRWSSRRPTPSGAPTLLVGQAHLSWPSLSKRSRRC